MNLGHKYSQLYEEHWDPIQHLTFKGLFEEGRKAPGSFDGGELLLVHEYMKSGRYFILGQSWGYRLSYVSDQLDYHIVTVCSRKRQLSIAN